MGLEIFQSECNCANLITVLYVAAVVGTLLQVFLVWNFFGNSRSAPVCIVLQSFATIEVALPPLHG